jgi:hypothetical protein
MKRTGLLVLFWSMVLFAESREWKMTTDWSDEWGFRNGEDQRYERSELGTYQIAGVEGGIRRD